MYSEQPAGPVLGAYAGPGMTWPVFSEADVKARLIEAKELPLKSDRDTMRGFIILIAERYGWTNALPSDMRGNAGEYLNESAG